MDPFLLSVLASVIANAASTAICEIHKNAQKRPDSIPSNEEVESALLALPVRSIREYRIDDKVAEELRYAIGNCPSLQNHISKYLQLYTIDPTTADVHRGKASVLLRDVIIKNGVTQSDIIDSFESFLTEALASMRRSYGNLFIADEHRIIIEMVSELTADYDQRRLHQLIPYLLVGRWKNGNGGDIRLLTKLGAESDPERFPLASLNREDTPFRLRNDIWDIPFRESILSRVLPYISNTMFRQFEEYSLKVLVELDPALNLPADERHLVSVRELKRRYSGECREGVAEGLLLLKNCEGIPVPGLRGICPSIKPYVARIAYQIMNNAEWKSWASIGHELPVIADTAPGAFLRQVRESLESGESGVLRLFSEGGGLLGNYPHVNLIWALERIAWLPEHYSEAVLVLAQFAHLTPEIQISNSPIRSLICIFRPILGQTTASLEQKNAALRTITEQYPDVGRDILLGIIPSRARVILDSNVRPYNLRGWEHPDRSKIDLRQFQASVDNTIRLFSEHYKDPESVSSIVEVLPDLHPNARERVFDAIKSIESKEDAEAGSPVWKSLRNLLHWERRLDEEKQDISGEELDMLESEYTRLTPSDIVARYTWLFSYHPEPHFVTTELDPVKDPKVVEVRSAAIADLMSQEDPIPLLIDLIESVKAPNWIGKFLAETELSVDGVNEILGSLDEEDENHGHFFLGFIRALVEKKSVHFSDIQKYLVEHGSARKLAYLFLSVEAGMSIWKKVESLGVEVERAYWSLLSLYDLDPRDENYNYAIRTYLKYDQVIRALRATYYSYCLHSHGSIAEAVDELLRAVIDNAHDLTDELPHQRYELRELLSRFDELEVNLQLRADCEMALFGLFRHTDYGYPAISKIIIHKPDEYANLIVWTYKPSTGEPRDLNEQERALAAFGYHFLHEWQGFPGLRDSEVEEKALRDWVLSVLSLCDKNDRGGIARLEVGRILARSPSTEKDAPLHRVARDIIQELNSVSLEDGVKTELLNSRGTWSKPLGEGGKQERDLAKQYRVWAELTDDKHSKVKQIFNRLAKIYEEDADKEDCEAEEYLD